MSILSKPDALRARIKETLSRFDSIEDNEDRAEVADAIASALEGALSETETTHVFCFPDDGVVWFSIQDDAVLNGATLIATHTGSPDSCKRWRKTIRDLCCHHRGSLVVASVRKKRTEQGRLAAVKAFRETVGEVSKL